MLDDGMVYWDVRPSAKFPTVEVRVSDVPATVAETVLYASWVSIDSGKPSDSDDSDDQKLPFRERLDVEMGDWQAIADFVNAQRPAGSPPMRAIPGPLIMAAIFDCSALMASRVMVIACAPEIDEWTNY